MANTISNIRIEPANYTWANSETTKVTAVADSSGNLGATYFTFYLASGTGYYAWIDVDNGSVDPTPAGFTAIEVDISADDTAATVAAACVTALDAVSGVNCKIDPNDSTTFVLQNAAEGTVTAGVVDTGSTGFTITQQLAGSSFDMGFIEGDTEFALEEDMFDVTAQQEGTTIIEKIKTGSRVSGVSFAMKESTAAKLKTLLEAGGASVTPAAGTEVTGWGSSKRFDAISQYCRRLIINPTRLGSSDRTENICAWRAYPMVQSTNYSGESNKLINVEFQFLPDPLIADAQNHFIIGDQQQKLLK